MITNQPKWKIVEYSRNQIIKAGKTIKNNNALQQEIDKSTDIIDNWRAAHAFPMHVIYMHLRRMATTANKNIIVAERLKRLDSIINKLKREKSMSLWTMQDLGGCRFIVPTVDDVYNYANKYENSRKRHELVSMYDYINHPKNSGYRSLHCVYKYHSDSVDTYNKNILIEIQFRTHLQHLWATAVETMGLFTKEAIKSGQGTNDVKRFFQLTSALLAIKEHTSIPQNVINDVTEIILELEEINTRNNYLDFLSGIRVAVDFQKNKLKINQMKCKAQYYILILNYNTRRLSIKSYTTSQIDEANKVYNSIESTRAEEKIDAVLVNVSSFNALKSAYPNYFSDIGEFVDIITSYLKS